jgi:hypothetical protein
MTLMIWTPPSSLTCLGPPVCLHCCYTAVTLLLHCSYTFRHCCYTVVTLLSHTGAQATPEEQQQQAAYAEAQREALELDREHNSQAMMAAVVTSQMVEGRQTTLYYNTHCTTVHY